MRKIWLKGAGIIFVVFLVFLLAARAAEPSIRPVLYDARPSFTPPSTTVAPTTTVVPSTTVAPTTTVVTSTTVAPTTTVVTSTTAVPSTTVAPTTTIPIDEIAVLSASYQWGPNNAVVILQKVLGVDADGWYGPGTRSSHMSENEKRGLSLEGIPPVPTTTTTTTTQPPSGPSESVTTVPVVTTPPIAVVPAFGGMGAELVAQLLGQPCIADGNLSDCPPEVGALVSGLVG